MLSYVFAMDLQKFCETWLMAWSGNQPEKLRKFYAEDAYYQDPAKPRGLRGPELLPYFKKLLSLNPSWVWSVVEILPTEKGFCLKWKASIPVGCETIEEIGVDIVEITNGKISRNEVYFDRVNWLKQLSTESPKI